MLFHAILISTLAIGCHYQPCMGQRLCRNTSLSMNKAAFRFHQEEMLRGTADNFTLLIHLNWTITGVQNDEFDGYIVRLRDYPDYKSVLPVDDCKASSTHVWIKTDNRSMCAERNETGLQCITELATYGNFCACDKNTCPALLSGYPCHGTPELLEEKYRSIPNTRQSIKFNIKFNVAYQFELFIYFRKFVGRQKLYSVTYNLRCAKLVSDAFGLSQPEAYQKCCMNGVQSVLPYNIAVSDQRPVFKRNANETDVNATVSWLPPGDGEAVVKFGVEIQSISNFPKINPQQTAVIMKPVDIVSTVAANTNSCGMPRFSYEVELYNLQPGTNYRIDITTVFKESMVPDLCWDTQCHTTIYILAKEPAELCQEDFYLCDTSATCEEGYDNSTGRNARCTCGSGLYGDGLNKSLGTGCSEIDDCLNDRNECVEFACTDLRAPYRGVKCRCGDGYYGDGKASGSGCSSIAETALAISLPSVAVLIIIAAVIAWFIIRERRRRLDERFQKYIATDNGILISYLNPDANEEKGPWEPTFGVQWEIDRNNIRFDKVLGRGNYGIVHLAWLSKDDEDATGNGFAMNGAYRNGDFYNPVSSKETDDDNKLDANSMVVAVKCLQESTRNRENLVNFLEEIGFMLNIGEHENIVRIYGCTTTEEPVYLITEYLPYGDLLHFLWDAREVSSKGQADPVYKVTEESLCKMAKDVANGMAFLQQIRVIHGDIAARNVLVGNKRICKLSDFGLANDVYRYGWSKGDKEKLVPFKWISPERMMSGHVPITSKSDVWSYGNLIYEMFTLGCPPYPGVKHGELLQMLKSGYRMKKPNSCSDQVYDLMNKCWRWRASSRPTFGQLLKLLDNVIYQLQSRRGIEDMATAVEELDREEYENELQNVQQQKEHDYVNCNITAVENECERQTGPM